MRMRLRMAWAIGGERGFTLVELLVTISLLAVVLTAILSILDSTGTIITQDRERALAIPELERGLYRMTAELRQAYEVVGPVSPTTQSNYMDIRVRRTTPGSTSVVKKRVLYLCDAASPTDTAYRACYRYETDAARSDPAGTTPAGVTGELVADRLTNGTSGDPVFSGFSYPSGASRATYAKATVKAPSKGSRKSGQRSTIVLDDGFYMRNLDLVR